MDGSLVANWAERTCLHGPGLSLLACWAEATSLASLPSIIVIADPFITETDTFAETCIADPFITETYTFAETCAFK